MKGFTDIHHHILYGMDDGARSAPEMQAMLRRAAEEGITRIVATPHVTPGVQRFDREQYERALGEAREFCAAEGLELELHPGAEILYTDQTCRLLEDGRVPTMAHTEFVLVEFSPDVRYDRLREALTELAHCGFLPIVAHTERYACLSHRPSRLLELRSEADISFQVNCASIIEPKSFLMKRLLNKMVEWELLDAVATDAHHAKTVRTVNMREAHRVLKREFGAEYAHELTDGHLLFDAQERETAKEGG